VFCGTLTGRGLQVEVDDGTLRIVHEGALRKFVDSVGHITFAAAAARDAGQPALYITERAVFELDEHGITLVEVAPGLDVERDVVAHMDFRPRIGSVRPMPADVFRAPARSLTHPSTEKEGAR